jgi:spore maturation protein CgeB
MKLGFIIKWPKGSLNRKEGNVIGDELLGESLSKAINKKFPEISSELYAENYLPAEKLDILVYLNEMEPRPELAKKHVIYVQNGGFYEAPAKVVDRINSYGFNGFVSFAKLLIDIQKERGIHGLYLPFGVDIELFKPQPEVPELAFEASYIGNDIKGTEVTMKYLYPAIHFDFGLFGNWPQPPSQGWRFWKNPPYKKAFAEISRGKIAQEDVPSLYRSSKINLNCTLQDCIDWNVITLRTLEVLACEGFLISDRVPLAEELLSDFIVFTDGGNDLRRKISYYLRHPEIRRAKAEAGARFVRKNFSVEATAEKLIAYLGELA